MKGDGGVEVAVLSRLRGCGWAGRGRPCCWELIDQGETVTVRRPR